MEGYEAWFEHITSRSGGGAVNKGLLMTLLVLIVLIALLVLIAMLFGQTADLGDSEIGWITWLGVSLL